LVRLLPGDATTLLLQEAKSSAADEAALRHQLGLDQPIVLQYVNWVGTLARVIWKSFKSRNPVSEELSGGSRSPWNWASWPWSSPSASPSRLGSFRRPRQDTWADYVSRSTAIGLLAILVSGSARS